MKDDLSNKNIITEIDPDSKDYTEIDYDQLDRLSERMDRLEEMIRQTSAGAISADTEIRPEQPEVEEAAIEQPSPEVSAAEEPVAAPAAAKPAKSSKSGMDAAQIFGAVGIGTVITAFCMGPLIAFFNRTVARPLLSISAEVPQK